MDHLTELKQKRDTLKAELKATDAAISAEESRLFAEKLASAKAEGKVSRWFLVWFGYCQITVRTEFAMTAEQLASIMDPKAIKERIALHGRMAVEAVSKHRYYEARKA